MSIIRTTKYDAVRYLEMPTINPKEYIGEINLSELEAFVGEKYIVKYVPVFPARVTVLLGFHYIEIRERKDNSLVITLMPGQWLVRYKSGAFVVVSYSDNTELAYEIRKLIVRTTATK